MAPRGRAIWSGSVSFGLVNVPIRVYTATKSHGIRFNQIDRESGSRIRYRKVAEATGEEVPTEQIVKGFELSPGQYVTIDSDELAALNPKASRMIDIEEFVDLADIDPLFFDQPYYLVPDKGAGKAYRLLVETMEQEGRAAIGRVIMRSKEYLVAIRPLDGVLCMETLRFDDEVVKPEEMLDDVEAAGAEVSAREVAMAAQLVEGLTAKWDPTKFADTYHDEVADLIERKAAGLEVVASPAPASAEKVVDLMAALEASIEASRKMRDAKEEPTATGS
ncbi:MAG: Ku protein [Acidimicrobiia bacterium]|nr:Ku protein [Acidimicrobiia bacterium]